MDLEGKIVQLLDKVQEAAPKIGAKAVEYGLADTFYGGLMNLIVAGLFAILASVAWTKFAGYWRECHRSKPEGVDGYDWRDRRDNYNGCCWVAGIASGVTSLVVLVLSLNIWNWVAVFDTDRALAHRILEKVLGS